MASHVSQFTLHCHADKSLSQVGIRRGWLCNHPDRLELEAFGRAVIKDIDATIFVSLISARPEVGMQNITSCIHDVIPFVHHCNLQFKSKIHHQVPGAMGAR